ncbi:MAG: DUF433 domain-containing protein [Bryobacteraceae bacterium]
MGQARMTDNELLDRITIDPKVMVGKPVIRGTRLTVDYIMGRLAHGATENEILEEHDYLSSADIHACIQTIARR